MPGLAPALLAALLLAAGAASADGGPSRYAGMEDRRIKALSTEQIDDLLEGRGMGLALAAELNHHPGPVHVLEAADALALTPAQEAETRSLLGRMRAEAIPLGRRIIALEAELEGLFATGAALPEEIEPLVMAIAETKGRLRYVHLGYHLTMRELLTPRQRARYDELRGYDGGGHRPGGGHGGH